MKHLKPILLGTKRRIIVMKSCLKTTKEVTLEYVDFVNQKKTFTFDLENLEYPILGSRKQDLIVTSDNQNCRLKFREQSHSL